MELESAHLYDPQETVPVSPGDERVIPDGCSAVYGVDDVQGDYEPGDDVRFFVWDVVGDSAYLGPLRTVTGEELRALEYRVVLRP